MVLHAFYFLLFYKAWIISGIYGKVDDVAAALWVALSLAVEVGTCVFF